MQLGKKITNNPKVACLAISLFILVIFTSSYFIAISKMRAVSTDQLHYRQKIIVDSTALSINVFLDMTKKSLLHLSRNTSVIDRNNEMQGVLDNFVLDWENTPVSGIIRADKSGKIVYWNGGKSGMDAAIHYINLAERDYFIWAKTAAKGDTYLGRPRMHKKEKSGLEFVVPHATPIYKEGVFDGVLSITISLDKSMAAYLDPLGLTTNSRAYLIHPDGTILASKHGYQGLVGLNYFEYLEENPYPGSEDARQKLIRASNSKQEGAMEIELYSPIEKKPIKFLVNYSPVFYNDKYFALALATPATDIEKELVVLKKNGIAFIFLFAVVMLSLSLVGTSINLLKSLLKKTQKPAK